MTAEAASSPQPRFNIVERTVAGIGFRNARASPNVKTGRGGPAGHPLPRTSQLLSDLVDGISGIRRHLGIIRSSGSHRSNESFGLVMRQNVAGTFG